MFLICFKVYFEPIYIYTKKMLALATHNHSTVFLTSFTIVGFFEALKKAFLVDVFGIPNMLLLLVISTILIDAYYGVRRSILESRQAYSKALTFEVDSPDYRKWMKISKLKAFQFKKMQFTFFKCFTLLGYLFFVKILLKFDDDNVLGFILGYTSNLILKLPLALFWYYDFKSIGENSAYIYGKKASIFKIVEAIFELRIKKQIDKLNDK